MKKGYIAPSLMCLDLMNAQRDLERLEKVGVDYLHVDIMDNHFVPNITLSADFVRAVRRVSRIPLDVHLMVEDPARLTIPQLTCCGEGDVITIHYESTIHPLRALNQIRQMGCKAGVALNPATPLGVLEDILDDVDMVLIMTVNPGFAGQKLVSSTLDKIARLRSMLNRTGHQDILIEVDGNVSFENAEKMHAAGADIYVTGTSSLFSRDGSLEENTQRFRRIIQGD